MNVKPQHAIVIGGSIGGLVAARVLTDHFVQVTLLERDEFPALGEQRRGVPQGRHTHGLLGGGREALETLYPGLTDEAAQHGAVVGDIVRNGRWVHQRGYLNRTPSNLLGVAVSRPLLEGLIRERTLALPNLSVQQGVLVKALSCENGRVTGVWLESGASLKADLVIDATGRGSKSPEWLKTLGYDAPETERVEVGLAYTTMFFEREPGHLGGDICAVVPPEAEGKRGGVMVAQEGNRWAVTLIRHFGAGAPADLAGFREYAATLPVPDIYEVVRHARPVGEAATMKYPASARRLYEKLTRFPEGFVVFGDAICSFNPVYGQGMTVAAMEALALGRCLQAGLRRIGLRFFRAAKPLVDIPWAIAVGNDLRIPETSGRRTLAVRLVNWYVDKFHRAAHHDAVLSVAFHQVANLLAPPPSLFHPKLLWRVWRGQRPPRQATPALERRTA